MIKLGKKVVVSDPCYDLPTWCQIVLDKVLPGNYTTNINTSGGICSSLSVLHEKYQRNLSWEKHPDVIGVDSGQAGVFSLESYRSNDYAENNINTPGYFNDWNNEEDGEEWYNRMCYLTLQEDHKGGSYDEGVVASSGYGDGSYDLYIAKNEGNKIVGMKIIFVDDEDNE